MQMENRPQGQRYASKQIAETINKEAWMLIEMDFSENGFHVKWN
jgi:hypothetical protein